MNKFNRLFNTIMEEVNSSKKDVILEFAPSKYKELNLDYARRAAKSDKNFSGFWSNFSENYNLTPEIVREFQNKINWRWFSTNRKFPFTDEFLEEFKDKINWQKYCETHQVSEQTYLKFRKKYIKPAYFVWPEPLRQVKMKPAELEAFLTKYWEDTEGTGVFYNFNFAGRNNADDIYTERQHILRWGLDEGLSPQFLVEHASTPREKYIVRRQIGSFPGISGTQEKQLLKLLDSK